MLPSAASPALRIERLSLGASRQSVKAGMFAALIERLDFGILKWIEVNWGLATGKNKLVFAWAESRKNGFDFKMQGKAVKQGYHFKID
jgi:hypothetical protein